MTSLQPTASAASEADALNFEPLDLPSVGAPRPRLWARLWVQALALAVVLAALVPLLDNGSMISADEGAALAQLEVLDSTGGWSLENPYPEVDADGRWFGFEKAERHGDRFYPYAKHAVYPAAMRPFFAIGELRGVLFASALGTWFAALFAALLARRVPLPRTSTGVSDPRLAIATLWTVGVVSPVFFDSFWVIAHSIGAALSTGAALCAVVSIQARRFVPVGGVVVGLVGAGLFRSEGVLFAIALAVGAGLCAVAPMIAARRVRSADWVAACVTVASATSGVVARELDAWIASRIMGGASVEPFSITDSDSWLAGRLQGAWSSLLRPQLMATTAAGTLFLSVAVLGVVGALIVRRSPGDIRLIRGITALAGVLALVALGFRKAPVPGLLVAFPVLPIGLALLGRTALRDVTTRLIVIAAGAYGAAVVLTQYSIGGSMEWGGRYLHLSLPMLVPVLLSSLVAAGETVDRTTRRLGLAALVVVSCSLLVFSIGTVTRLHGMTKPLVDTVIGTADASGARTGQPPVVVTNMEALARLTWRQSTHARYLAVPKSEELSEVARRMRADGLDEFVFASAWDHHADRALLRGYEVARGRTETVGDWRISVMEAGE